MSTGKLRPLRLDQLNLPQPALRSGRWQLDELAASVETLGVLVPLVVRPMGDEYVVIAGAGRLEALRLNGAGPGTKVPCIVVEASDADAVLLGLVENLVREGMQPFDEAEAVRLLVTDYGRTQTEVGRALGRSQAWVSQRLKIYRLDAKVIAALRNGKVEMQAARALLPIVEDRKAQRSLLKRMIAERLTATQVSALVAKLRYGEAARAPVSFEMAGVGSVDLRTTAEGKIRVIVEGEDDEALVKLWKLLEKRM